MRYAGRFLRRENHSEKDQIAGLFRIYYADFVIGQNHNVRAREILDTYQHTFDYADVVLNSDETPFSRRLRNLLGNEIGNFNFLILDRVELLPKYRGTGVGLLVLLSWIERFGAGAGVVGMKPFPLQLEATDATDSRWRSRLRMALEKLVSNPPRQPHAKNVRKEKRQGRRPAVSH
jgi:hypothetical protein